MKKTWFMWVLILGVIITIFVIFNYQGGQNIKPLSEIFPEDESFPIDVEYEFIDEITKNDQDVSAVPRPAAPIKEIKTVTEKKTGSAVEVQKILDTANKNFTIQVASFRDRNKADEIARKLKEENFTAEIVARDLGGKGTWHRVYVGNFESKNQAEDVLLKIKNGYKGSFIIVLKE